MKLFSPTLAKIAHNGKRDEEITQVAYLTNTLEKLQNNINKENDAFTKKLEEQRKVYTAEKIALQAEIRVQEGVLQSLKDERKAFMIPVDVLKTEAEKMDKELKEKLSKVKERETELEDMIESITERLDKVMEKESVNNEWELSLKVRQLGIDAESEQVSTRHTQLNKEMKEFLFEVETRTIELDKKEKRIEIDSMRAKEYFENRDMEMKKGEKSLADRRAAFQREYDRFQLSKLDNKLNNQNGR